MSLLNNRIAAVVAGSALVVGLGATGAVAGDLIGSGDIRDGAVHRVDLAQGVKDRIQNKATETQVNGIEDRVTGLESEDPAISDVEADGPYPTFKQLQDGDNSMAAWTNNGLQASWVQCAPGKTALGGGFGDNDGDNSGLQIVTSAPVQIENGAVVYSPIEGDADGSFQPNGWLVEGYNSGADMIVRPWVICATIN